MSACFRVFVKVIFARKRQKEGFLVLEWRFGWNFCGGSVLSSGFSEVLKIGRILLSYVEFLLDSTRALTHHRRIKGGVSVPASCGWVRQQASTIRGQNRFHVSLENILLEHPEP